jgi:hypothetical protein
MDDLKAQIKFYSGKATNLSREAKQAIQAKDWNRSRELMKEAVAASKNCQKLIKLFQSEDENKICSE